MDKKTRKKIDNEIPVRLCQVAVRLNITVESLRKYHINRDPVKFDPAKLNPFRLGEKGWYRIYPSELERYIKFRNY